MLNNAGQSIVSVKKAESDETVPECNGHDISCMADEGGRLLACFDVPESTGHVPAKMED